MWEAYEAAQGWIVVTIIGAAIGLNAALLNIVTEWLSDIKMGYCSTAFYLNESFCCWGEEEGEFCSKGEAERDGNADRVTECPQWHRWTVFEPLNYFIYICVAVCTHP